MGICNRVAFTLAIVCGMAAVAIAGGEPGGIAPRVGQVQALAIAPDNHAAIAALHKDGWLQANGALLRASEFPELYDMIGRTWTADGVKEDRFALPDLHDTLQQPRSADNPFSVLGPGDLVNSNHAAGAWMRRAPLSYWIFVGRDLSGTRFDAPPLS
jgi:hypothetical protein